MSLTANRFSATTLGAAILLGILTGAAIAFLTVNYWLASADQRTSQQRGQDLAILVCSQCHTISTTGKSPNPAAPPFHKLVEKLSEEGLSEQLDVALSLGHSPMPPWKLSPEQANDLLTFIVMLKVRE